MSNIYRVLRGSHYEQGKKFKQGDILNSLSNLERMNSPGAIKFQKMPEGTPLKGGEPVGSFNTANEQPSVQASTNVVTPDTEELESMSVAELKQMAYDYELDFKSSVTKAELVNLLSEALS